MNYPKVKIRIVHCRHLLFALVATSLLVLQASASGGQGSESGLKERVATVAEQAKSEIKEAGDTAAKRIETLWKRIDERRLKNRTFDEIVAWVIMGLLVGGVAGQFSAAPPTGLRRVGFLGLGLAGAFVGGLVAHVTQADFNLGPVLIRYEDLLISLGGGLLVTVGFRLYVARRRRRALLRASQAATKT